MRNYVKAAKISAFLTIISFFIALTIHYLFEGKEADFWCNISLAIFGSGLLTYISALLGYYSEKRHVMEGFSYATKNMLHFLNKYDRNQELDKKIDFFIEYEDLDKSQWDAWLGDIYFMYDPRKEKFGYIYQSLYKPLLDLNQVIEKHQFHFRWHKDGSGKNDEAMKIFISEIESFLVEETKNNIMTDDGSEYEVASVRNRIVYKELDERNGRYYDIMYNHNGREKE